MNSKELRKQVVDKIYEGKSYQEIYDELRAICKNREHDLAKLIGTVPSLQQRKQFWPFNVALIVLLAISIFLKVLVGFSLTEEFGAWALLSILIMPIIEVVLLVGVVAWKPIIYRPIGFIGCWSFLTSLKTLLTPPFDPWLIVSIVLIAGFIFLGFFLHQKLGGKYELGREKYRDANNNVQTRQAVKWLN